MKKLIILLIFLLPGMSIAQEICVNSSGHATKPTCSSDNAIYVDAFGQRVSTTTALTVTAGAYTAGDVIGGEQTCTGGRSPGYSGIIRSITVADKADQGVNLRFHFFKSNPASNIADNAAFDPSDADLLLYIGGCDVTQHYSFTDNGISLNVDCDLHFDTTSGTLYYYIEAVDAPTYVSTSDVQVTIVVEQD